MSISKPLLLPSLLPEVTLLLEDMLVAHPDLEVFVMHAGGFFWERTLQLMHMYPQVYAELGVLAHAPTQRRTGTLV